MTPALCDIKHCTGCSACMAACQRQAISMKADCEGFLFPETDPEACTGCGLCEKACPQLARSEGNRHGGQPDAAVGQTDAAASQTLENSGRPAVFAAWSKTDSVRCKSSSGGLFFTLAQKIISDGGVVFGAVLSEDGRRVFHSFAESLDAARPMMGSKYVQSDLGDSFRKAADFLKAGRKVLFTGTPCQIAGLYGFLGKRPAENLYTVDLVCHGVPSSAFLQFYLDNSAVQASLKKSGALSFRDPSTWPHCFTGPMKDYVSLYLSGRFMRESCYSCSYASVSRVSDITIGDFWGIGDSVPFEEDTSKGCSLVLVNTSKGSGLIESVRGSLFLEERGIEEALVRNTQLQSATIRNSKRDSAYEFLACHSLPRVILRFEDASASRRIRHYLKQSTRKIIMKKSLAILAAILLLAACAPKGAETTDFSCTAKLEKIKKNLSKTGDKFVYFCDTHTEKEEECATPFILDTILSAIPVDKVIFGGDFCMTSDNCATKEDVDCSVANFTKNVEVVKGHGVNFYCLRGNHDMTTGTINPEHVGFTYSQRHVHETIMGFCEGSPLVESDDLSCSLYFDKPEASLRYILLDPYSSTEEDEFVRYGQKMEFAGAATDWCKKCLESLPEGWKAVILVHQGLNKATGCCDFNNLHGVLELVNANPEKVAMVLHGHTHKDAETFENGVLHVCTTSCIYHQSKGDLFGAVCRRRNTPDESALDVVDINIPEGKINMWRIGFGHDRLININPIKVKSGETLRLKPSLKNVDEWKIYDADGIHVSKWYGWENDAVTDNNHAILEEGARLVAFTPGEVVAVATDSKARSREYFYIVVE